MAKVRYEAYMYYTYKPSDNTVVAKGIAPIIGFSVFNSPSGNQNNLSSTKEIDIEAKLREAVTYKNLTVDLLPTQGIEAVEIGDFFHWHEKFDIQFRVEVYSGKTMTKSFNLESDGVELMDYPRAGKNKIHVIMILTNGTVESVSAKTKTK